MGIRSSEILKALFTGTQDDNTPVSKIAICNKNMTQEETNVYSEAKTKKLSKFKHIYD